MSTWQEGLLEAMTEYVQRQYGPDSRGVKDGWDKAIDPEVTVTSCEDTSGWSGGCETCEYYDTNITFYLSNDTTKQYYGSFAELINELG